MEYEELLATVKTFYGDTTRSQGATRADLLALVDEIELLVETLGE